jgi:hypothetical protein
VVCFKVELFIFESCVLRIVNVFMGSILQAQFSLFRTVLNLGRETKRTKHYHVLIQVTRW